MSRGQRDWKKNCKMSQRESYGKTKQNKTKHRHIKGTKGIKEERVLGEEEV